MKIKKIISIILAALTLMAVAVPALAATGDTLYITSENGYIVNVRSGPGTNYSKAPAGEYSVGTRVYVVDDHSYSTWTKVRDDDGNIGWVMSQFLEADSTTYDNQEPWEKLYGPGVTRGDDGPSTKQQIKNMQEALIEENISVGSAGADGYYGTNTRNAIKTFQARNGLSQTGYADLETKEALYNATH